MCRPAPAKCVRGDYSAGGAGGHRRPVETDLGGTAASGLLRRSPPAVRVSRVEWGRRRSAAALQTPGPSGPWGLQPDPQLSVPGGEGPTDTRLGALGCVVVLPRGPRFPCLLMPGSENGLGLGTGRPRPGKGWPPARVTCTLPAAHPFSSLQTLQGRPVAPSSALLPAHVSSGHRPRRAHSRAA